MAIVPQHFIDPVFLQHNIMKHNGQQLNNSIMSYFGYCIMTFENIRFSEQKVQFVLPVFIEKCHKSRK